MPKFKVGDRVIGHPGHWSNGDDFKGIVTKVYFHPDGTPVIDILFDEDSKPFTGYVEKLFIPDQPYNNELKLKRALGLLND